MILWNVKLLRVYKAEYNFSQSNFRIIIIAPESTRKILQGDSKNYSIGYNIDV